VTSEDGIEFRLRAGQGAERDGDRVLLVVLNEDEAVDEPGWVGDVVEDGERIVYCEPRGIGATKWTRKNPPNYAERSHVLVGRTVDAGRIWDVVAAAGYVREQNAANAAVRIAGKGAAAIIAGYAAALDDRIAGAALVEPMTTHVDNKAPQLLNVLRTADIPDVLGLIAPRSLAIEGATADDFIKTQQAFSAAEADEKLSLKR
jgi:hypothetical protein